MLRWWHQDVSSTVYQHWSLYRSSVSLSSKTFHTNYIFHWKEDVLFMIIIGYLKNHWTKHRLVCTHFDAFSMLNPNMDMICDISEIFEFFYETFYVSSPLNIHPCEGVNIKMYIRLIKLHSIHPLIVICSPLKGYEF